MQENQGKIKVLYAITKGVWGGAQKYVFELSTSLPKEKYEVFVVHGWGDALASKLEECSIPTFYIKDLGKDVNFFKDISSFFDLIGVIKKTRPNILHLNSSKIGGIGAIAGRLVGVQKIIFTVHGFAFNEERSWIQKKIITFLSWLSIVMCTDVIFISEIEMHQAQKWPWIKNKTHLVYNGITSPEFVSQKEARKKIAEIIEQPENIFEGKTIIGSIGELTKNKGLKYAVEATQYIPDCLYIIIGDGEKEKHLRELIVLN